MIRKIKINYTNLTNQKFPVFPVRFLYAEGRRGFRGNVRVIWIFDFVGLNGVCSAELVW